MRITRAGADPNGTQHKVSVVVGRVGAAITASGTPLVDTGTAVVDVPPGGPTPMGGSSPAAPSPCWLYELENRARREPRNPAIAGSNVTTT